MKKNTFLIISFLLLASFLFSSTVLAETTSNTINIDPGDYQITTDFEFNGFGVKWSKEYSNPKITINNTLIEAMEGAYPGNPGHYFSDPIFEISTQLNISTNVPLEISYFDSRPAPEPSLTNSVSTELELLQTKYSIDVVTRDEWGADDSYRFWEPSYTEPTTFVIHHTAGSDGGDDPMATVRGIYYYHAQILGWGDIGYNYLIDKSGNIYEGRYGGDKVIGAHAYNDYTNIDYNQYTIGISVMGCYDETACSEPDEYTSQIQSALTNLISNKASDLSISLNGQRNLQGSMVDAVIGHKDIDYTACPGNLIYDQLDTIISKSKNKYSSLQVAKARKAKLKEHSFDTAYLIDTQETITVKYKNTGERNFPKNKVYLKVRDPETLQKKKIYIKEKVAVGEEYTFNFKWDFDTRGEHTISLRLFRDEDQYISKSRTYITYRVDSPYHAVLKNQNLPTAIQEGWNPEVTLNYKNKGTSTWRADDTALYVNGEFLTYLDDAKVDNPSRGHFTFNLQDISGLKKKKNTLTFQLWQDGNKIKNSRYIHKLRID